MVSTLLRSWGNPASPTCSCCAVKSCDTFITRVLNTPCQWWWHEAVLCWAYLPPVLVWVVEDLDTIARPLRKHREKRGGMFKRYRKNYYIIIIIIVIKKLIGKMEICKNAQTPFEMWAWSNIIQKYSHPLNFHILLRYNHYRKSVLFCFYVTDQHKVAHNCEDERKW